MVPCLLSASPPSCTGSNLPKCPRPVPRPPVQLPRKRRLGKFEGGREVAWPPGQLAAQSRKDGPWRSSLQVLSAPNTVEGCSSSLPLEAQHRYTNELGKPLEIKRFHIRKDLFSFSWKLGKPGHWANVSLRWCHVGDEQWLPLRAAQDVSWPADHMQIATQVMPCSAAQ